MEQLYAQIYDIHLKPGDKLVRKKLYKHAVPMNYEFKLLLDLFFDGSKIKLGLGMIGIQIMRPIELAKLAWPKFVFTADKRSVVEYYHDVHKAGSTQNLNSTTHLIKEVRKPILSPWLSDQIILYRQLYPTPNYNKTFPWTTADPLNKEFNILRKKVAAGELGSQYNFLLEKNDDVLIGQATNTQYRVCPYALRRFGCTFHYWVTFRQDVFKLAEFTGHANPETLLKFYVKPKEAIGLTNEMIAARITIDQFIHLHGRNQIVLTEFLDDDKPIFLTPGQSRLIEFM